VTEEVERMKRELQKKEQNRAVASGKDYAKRPPSYKQALSLKLSVGTARARSRYFIL